MVEILDFFDNYSGTLARHPTYTLGQLFTLNTMQKKVSESEPGIIIFSRLFPEKIEKIPSRKFSNVGSEPEDESESENFYIFEFAM